MIVIFFINDKFKDKTVGLGYTKFKFYLGLQSYY